MSFTEDPGASRPQGDPVVDEVVASRSDAPPAAVPEAPPSSAAQERSAERQRGPQPNMLPGRGRRRFGIERVLVRLIATFGIVGIGVALGAILASSKVQGWIIGLVVAGVSVILSAILWSSKQL